MAKSPRKGSSLPQAGRGSKTVSRSKSVAPSVGGKNFKTYGASKYYPSKRALKSSRRFSIADSSSSDSEITFVNKYSHSSDSESSLTAVSENDEDETFQVSNSNNKKYKTGRKATYASKQTKSKRPARDARKRMPKDWNWNQIEKQHLHDDAMDEDEDEDEDEDNEDDEEEDEDEDGVGDEDLDNPDEIGLEGLYSLMNSSRQSDANDATDASQSSQDEEDEDAYSSSDDSDVDFVKLQAERKAARSMKSVHALKGLGNKQSKNDLALMSDSDEEVEPSKNVKNNRRKSTTKKNRRTSSVSKLKFGRRKSEAPLPEDINFTFDFGELGETAVDDDMDYEDNSQDSNEGEGTLSNDNFQEEDVGEEVNFSFPSTPKEGANHINSNLEFDFDTPIIQVPKINEEELNSDEDYEIDDNELLATLHADSDIDDLVDDYSTSFRQSRNNSMGSLGDDAPFLKEEEKFLVNEFENNGFDDEQEDLSINDSANGTSMLSTLNDLNNKKQVVQYDSSVGNESDDYDDEEEEEFEDFVDFDVPLFDKDFENVKDDDSDEKQDSLSQYFRKTQIPKKSSKSKNKKALKSSVINSDEEDDSYLWNYFFSSGESNDENDVERYNDASEDDEVDVDLFFREMDEQHKKNRKPPVSAGPVRRNLLTLTSHAGNDELFDLDDGYDSGESTDVDLSLPVSSKKSNIGSKRAKEVLSSKTADYRPPVLGTWVTVDSKPFGIIDGLSTRTLVNSNNNMKGMEPRTKGGRKSIVPSTGTDDLALGLDELLNISELDNDDENDVKIWRDFNSQKKLVPLGAFRNKSVLQNSLIYGQYNKGDSGEFSHTSVYPRRNSVSRGIVKKQPNGRRNSATKSKIETGISLATSKQIRRRSSIAEAVSEGYRPTKSGLFSENSLADIEEVFGDDNEFLSLIKGL